MLILSTDFFYEHIPIISEHDRKHRRRRVFQLPQQKCGYSRLQSKKGLSGGKGTAGFDVDKKAIMNMMSGFTLLRLTGLMGMTGVTFTKEELLEMNRKLNKIKKKK